MRFDDVLLINKNISIDLLVWEKQLKMKSKENEKWKQMKNEKQYMMDTTVVLVLVLIVHNSN